MAFLLETHMHTYESSACGRATSIEQVHQYKKAGYDGVIVSDHFITGNSAVDRSLPWEQQMRDQFAGFRHAKEEGELIGIKVFCGIEYGYHGTEWIILGLDENWFIDHPEVLDMKPEEFLPFMRSEGAAIIHAHPYREADYIEEFRLYPDLVDAVEVYNFTNKDPWNDKAIAYAMEHNLPMTAGSDCHHIDAMGAGIVLDENPETIDDLVRIIKSGKGWKIYTKYKELNL